MDDPADEDPVAIDDTEEIPIQTTFAINEPVRDIGHLASWTLSSAKPDHGEEALRAPSVDLYWQSDGPQPHKLNILFPKRVGIRWISMYFDYVLDESYTPSKIALSAGTSLYDLTEVKTIDLHQPRGWHTVNIGDLGRNGVIKAFLFQILVLANHQNGKDTHLRGVKIFAPGTEYSTDGSGSVEGQFLNEEQERMFSIR